MVHSCTSSQILLGWELEQRPELLWLQAWLSLLMSLSELEERPELLWLQAWLSVLMSLSAPDAQAKLQEMLRQDLQDSPEAQAHHSFASEALADQPKAQWRRAKQRKQQAVQQKAELESWTTQAVQLKMELESLESVALANWESQHQTAWQTVQLKW